MFFNAFVDILTNYLFSQEFEDEYSNTEPLYIQLGLGYANPSYPLFLQLIVDDLKNDDGITKTSMYIDLGLYWHIAPQTIIGPNINGVGDRFQDEDENYFQMNQYIYGVSVMHYLIRSFGSGVFIRGDAGLAKVISVSDIYGIEYNITSDNGFGYLVGGGYSFDTDGTRILLNINYTSHSVEDYDYSSVNVGVNFLF